MYFVHILFKSFVFSQYKSFRQNQIYLHALLKDFYGIPCNVMGMTVCTRFFYKLFLIGQKFSSRERSS